MSEQGTSSGFDSTLTSRGRGQSDDQTTSAEKNTSEVRTSPAPQRSVAGNYNSGLPSEQAPRSTAAATPNGTQSPVTDSPSAPLAYEASQQQQQLSSAHQLKPHQQQTKVQGSKLHSTRESIALERQRKQQIKLEQQQQKLLQKLQHDSNQRQQKQQQQQQEQEQEQPQLPQHASQQGHQPHHRLSHLERQQQQQTATKIDLPVTKATLSELDVTKIIHNPKLRHDINYDPELHFRPNLDGEKGRRKQDKAQQFWDTLREELTQFVSNRDEFLKTHGPTDEWSLPALLSAVKEIIQTLVPARDRELLNDGLNVPLLMQQFGRGVVDLEKLASWLSSVLKLHCAPMRDDWVDEMYNELSRGNRENDVDELVKGMCSLLSVLEAMKLDVANHQIRCLRPLLIEDTVHFEQRFFFKKIQHQRMSVDAAQNWYKQAKANFARPSIRHRQAFGDMAAFFGGLVHLLLPSTQVTQVPNTFLFDEDRIIKLRSDMFDAIYLEICMKVYELAEMYEIAAETSPEDITYNSTNINAYLVPSYLQPEAMQTADEDAYATPEASDDFDFNTPPQSAASGSPASSRPSSLAFSACGSSTSSPRNSGQLFESGAAPPREPEDFIQAQQRAQTLYSSLVAILQTMPPATRPSQRWEDMWPLMAVEIYRALSVVPRAQHVPLDQIELRLKKSMHPSCGMKQDVERMFKERLMSALSRRVKDYKAMPNVGLFVVAAGGRIHPTSARAPESATGASATAAATAAAAAAATLLAQKKRPIDPREDGCVEDMATRLAHLGIIHWRVWGRLVYEPTQELLSEDASMPVL